MPTMPAMEMEYGEAVEREAVEEVAEMKEVEAEAEIATNVADPGISPVHVLTPVEEEETRTVHSTTTIRLIRGSGKCSFFSTPGTDS